MKALGPDGTATLFLTFGGSTIYLAQKPRAGSRLAEALGRDGAASLFREFGSGHLKVPMAKGWIARHLDGKGVSRAEIARRLHITRESLRSHLAGTNGGAE